MKNNKKISAKVLENILLAVGIMIFFILINFSYSKLEETKLILGLKIVSGIVLIIGIFFLELAYKKDSGKIAINAIETLVLSGFILSIQHIVKTKDLKFQNYVLISSYAFSAYYILKAVIVFTKERKEYLKSFSDIREIVDIEPTKKEAEKRKK